MNGIPLSIAAAILVAGALLSALLSISETVVLGLRDYRVRTVLTKRPSVLPLVELWSRDPEKLLSPIIALRGCAQFSVAGAAFVVLKESGFLDTLGIRLILQIVTGILGAAFLIDFLPKRFALTRQDCAALITARTLAALRPLARLPGARFFQKTFLLPFAWLSGRSKRRRRVLGDEVGTLLGLACTQGVISEDEREVMQQILGFSQKTAHDCMTTRVDSPAVPDSLDFSAALSLSGKYGDRFLPLYHQDPDDIVAQLDLQQVILRPEDPLSGALRTPHFIPETTVVLDFLAERSSENEAPAIVLDEHGAFEGTLSRTALIDQLLLGPLSNGPGNQDIRELVPGERFLVRGATRLELLSKHSGQRLDCEGIDTVAGFVFTEFGRLPDPGEEVTVNGFRFRVQRVSGTRIEEVLVERLPGRAPER